MPSERRGTVTDNVAGYIRKLTGTSEWKGDKAGTIRAPVAKVCRASLTFELPHNASTLPQMHFPVEDVVRNIRYFMTMVKRATGNQRDPEAQSDKKDTSKKPGGQHCAVFGCIAHQVSQ